MADINSRIKFLLMGTPDRVSEDPWVVEAIRVLNDCDTMLKEKEDHIDHLYEEKAGADI